MTRNSMSTLICNLKNRTVQEQKEVEELMNKKLKQLSESFSKSVEKELNIIKESMVGTREKPGVMNKLNLELTSTMDQARGKCTNLSRSLARMWMIQVLTCLLICMGIFLGSWGLSTYLARDISMLIERYQSLRQEISSQEQTLAHLNSETWGVKLHQTSDGKFLILPQGTDLENIWRTDERAVLKLSGN